MEEWNKEQMERYFDTTELLKQLNGLKSAEKKGPQKQTFSLLNTKKKKTLKDKLVRRVLPLTRHTGNNRVR